jgi:FtsP/CotA-like multicopper oxidase with cupredoxin domain
MLEATIGKDQTGEEDRNETANVEQGSEVTRRNFLQYAIAATSGLAITSLLPPFALKTWAQQVAGPCPPGQPLQTIMEIVSSSSTKTLQAVLKVLDEPRTYLAPPNDGAAGVCVPNTGQMRYIAGYDPANPSMMWPTTKGVPSTAPTLRARVGDRVQITLLNHVNVKNFPGTLDVAENGQACDQNKSVGPGGTSVNTYPGDPSFEKPPNCFHGSSSTNLHFHGTHVSPSGISDNVLLNIRPSPRGLDGKPLVNEQSVRAIFAEIFAECASGDQILLWTEWPAAWQAWQKKLLIAYDKTAPWQGQPGTLPPDQQLWVQNVNEMGHQQLPQYYIGAFPNCFKIPVWNGQKTSMGQAPGTHWYHSHKHGSTALNLANGMAGALIIEGDYDDKLKPFFTKQRVLVLQQFGAVLPLLRSATGQKSFNTDFVYVNGQYTPVMQMNPNEMQLWRIVNACHQASVPLASPTGLKWVQTAQDGVQFDPKNYDPTVTNAAFSVPAKSKAPFGSLAPGNRVDLLVQAPSTPGPYQVKFNGKLLLTVNVKQDTSAPITSPMPFPTQAQFPQMPGFLLDIAFADVKVRRELHFKSTADPSVAPSMGRGKNPPYPPPVHTIDGKQFDEGTIDQTMQLGATEEWTLYNDGGAAHPFHIHINPFQVVEIMDPNQNGGAPVKLPRPWVWWDNFAIPTGGYVKMLTRFMDFTGMYVLHCHILGHEDRGMMQMVQVITNTTTMTHK